MPATNGTKARTTAVKRARKTLATPYLLINASLRSMNCGYRFSGQPRRISRWYRCPSQNDKPSPAMAPTIAATSRSHGFTSAPVARALIPTMSVEPAPLAVTQDVGGGEVGEDPLFPASRESCADAWENCAARAN